MTTLPMANSRRLKCSSRPLRRSSVLSWPSTGRRTSSASSAQPECTTSASMPSASTGMCHAQEPKYALVPSQLQRISAQFWNLQGNSSPATYSSLMEME